jgi:RNA polymerase sigma-70 factor (ECF subfamily)
MPNPQTSYINRSFTDFYTQLRNRDERAWSQLNFVLKRILFKWFCKKSIHPSKVDEIYNNTISVFLEKFEEVYFKDFSSLKSYIFSIAENKIKEYYRTEKRNNKIDTLESLNYSNYTRYLVEYDNEEYSEKINKIRPLIQKLSKDEQKLIRLIYTEERSFKESAQIMNITEGNLRVIKHRAIEKIKGLLNKT